jgi:hypothetical protein
LSIDSENISTENKEQKAINMPPVPAHTRRKSSRKRAFHDERLCDFCGKEGKKKCTQCGCAIYCSRECQKKDWRTSHKPVCTQLEKARKTPMIDEYLSSMRASPTQVGIAHSQHHGKIAFVMERKEWYHASESDREVLLASTTELSEKSIFEMICDSILYPEYDNDLAGSRRPDTVCIHSKSFMNDMLVRKIASIFTRLGIRVVDLSGEVQNVYCKHWLCVQLQWIDELYDEDFLKMVSLERHVPYEPNGQARKSIDFVQKRVPRLKPRDYPSMEQAMSLPFEQDQNTRGLWIAFTEHRLFICYHGKDGFSLKFHKELALQPNRRPYHEDVMLCIQHVLCYDVKVRPVGAWLGQPSICSHNDVEDYETALDGQLISGALTLGAMNSMESQLEAMLPRFYDAGLLEDDQSVVDDGTHYEEPEPLLAPSGRQND